MLTRIRTAIAGLARVALPALFTMHVGVANAEFITFDDLPPPVLGDFALNPLNTQYALRGLLIQGSYLIRPEPLGDPNQALLGTQTARLTFLDTLPSFVNLRVSSAFEDRIYVSAYGPGFAHTIATSGAAGPINSTPYVPNELVSFEAAGGISYITLTSFFNRRVGAVVDNLYFGPVPGIPEPAPLALAGIGLLLLAAAKRRPWRKG